MSAAPVRLQLGHSPDADDALMFYALATGKVDSEGIEFEHILRDIQTLNEWALEGRLDISAVSVLAAGRIGDRYEVMACGASVGDDYGPIVVAAEPLTPEQLQGERVAHPGQFTTAHLLARIFLPGAEFAAVPFDAVFDAVKSGAARAGVVIHEGQLTYADEGLHLVMDFGVEWKRTTGLPLPLGVNVIRRDLPNEVRARAGRAMRRSIEYAIEHLDEALDHALGYARGLDRERAKRFVQMYVNEYTLDLGGDGRAAVRLLHDRARELGLLTAAPVSVSVQSRREDAFLSDATPEATKRPKRSMRMPMLVLAILAALLAGVWWHIRSQHHPSLPLTGKVAYTVLMPPRRVDFDVFINGLPSIEGVRVETVATDSLGKAHVIGVSLKQKDEKTVQVHLKLELNWEANGVDLQLKFSHEVAVLTRALDRLFRLAPRREQIGEVSLKTPVFFRTRTEVVPL